MTQLPMKSRRLMLSLALTLGVTGIAFAASSDRTIVLSDEFGNPIQDAIVRVTTLNPAKALSAENVGGLDQVVARELRGGGYVISGGEGAMLVEVDHPSLGKVYAKVSGSAGQSIDLVAVVDASGVAALRTPGEIVMAKNMPAAAPQNPNVAGASCATATVIPWASITAAGGYTDNGATGTTDDQPVICGLNGSDGFYTFTAGASTNVQLTTCTGGALSPGDTVLQVRTGVCGAVVPGACNDDNCTVPPGGNIFNSTLGSVPVTNGTQYTIQIDNWASFSSLNFQLNVRLTPTVDCPPDGVIEGEPLCGLVAPPGCAPADFTNGGCNSNPPVFSPLACEDTICGTYGNCGTTRDTDWYQIVVPMGQVYSASWCCIGEGPSLFGLVNNNGGSGLCPATAFQAFLTRAAFQDGCVTQLLGPGTWWWFMGTSNFAGVPCGADYTCELNCVNLCGAPPEEESSVAFNKSYSLGRSRD